MARSKNTAEQSTTIVENSGASGAEENSMSIAENITSSTTTSSAVAQAEQIISAAFDVAPVRAKISASAAEIEQQLSDAEARIAAAEQGISAALDNGNEEQLAQAQSALKLAQAQQGDIQAAFGQLRPDLLLVALLDGLDEYQGLIAAELAKGGLTPAELAAQKQARIKEAKAALRSATAQVWSVEDALANGDETCALGETGEELPIAAALEQATQAVKQAGAAVSMAEQMQPGQRSVPAMPESLRAALAAAGQQSKAKSGAGKTGAPRQPRQSTGEAARVNPRTLSPLNGGLGGGVQTPMGLATAKLKGANPPQQWVNLFGSLTFEAGRRVTVISNGPEAIPAEFFVYKVAHPVHRDQRVLDSTGNVVTVTAPDAYTRPAELAYQAQLAYTGLRGDQLPAGTVIDGLPGGATLTIE